MKIQDCKHMNCLDVYLIKFQLLFKNNRRKQLGDEFLCLDSRKDDFPFHHIHMSLLQIFEPCSISGSGLTQRLLTIAYYFSQYKFICCQKHS